MKRISFDLFAYPHLFYKASVSFGKFSFRSVRVIPVQVSPMMVKKEVIPERTNKWQALNASVHEASVSYVLQADESLSALFLNESYCLIEVKFLYLLKSQLTLGFRAVLYNRGNVVQSNEVIFLLNVLWNLDVNNVFFVLSEWKILNELVSIFRSNKCSVLNDGESLGSVFPLERLGFRLI